MCTCTQSRGVQGTSRCPVNRVGLTWNSVLREPRSASRCASRCASRSCIFEGPPRPLHWLCFSTASRECALLQPAKAVPTRPSVSQIPRLCCCSPLVSLQIYALKNSLLTVLGEGGIKLVQFAIYTWKSVWIFF